MCETEFMVKAFKELLEERDRLNARIAEIDHDATLLAKMITKNPDWAIISMRF